MLRKTPGSPFLRGIHTVPKSFAIQAEESLQKLSKLNHGPFKPLKDGQPSKRRSNRIKTPADLIPVKSSRYEFERTAYTKLSYDRAQKGDVYEMDLDTQNTHYKPIEIPNQEEVPALKHSLSRVLFSPGVHYLQDPRTKVFNYDPAIQKIPMIEDFRFDKIGKYVSSSKDQLLSSISSQHGLKYYSSTSSMTAVLSQLHFLLSNSRPTSFINFTRNHEEPYGNFTRSAKMSASVIVKKQPNGTYSIDSDKSTDKEIILSLLGHSLERFLTKTPEEFSKYTKSGGEGEIIEANTYHYASMEGFLMRSQLDCRDSRLPGTGTFDLKTRAVNAVRYDISKVEKESTGYRILKTFGRYESFEREQLDLAKSTLIKYGLQARIGNMDGIFIAYHNTVKIFGFEYLPLGKIDEVMHSFGLPYINSYTELDNVKLSTKLADDEFKLSMKLWKNLMNLIIEKEIPDSSFRLILKARKQSNFETILRVIAQPISTEGITKLDNIGSKILMNGDVDIQEHADKIRELNEELCHGPIGYDIVIKNYINNEESHARHPIYTTLEDEWSVKTKIIKLDDKTAEESYHSCLDERIGVLKGSVDDSYDQFVEILRKYGIKGERLQELEDLENKEVIWNKE